MLPCCFSLDAPSPPLADNVVFFVRCALAMASSASTVALYVSGGAEQLLLHLGFMETVKLHSIDFVAPANGKLTLCRGCCGCAFRASLYV